MVLGEPQILGQVKDAYRAAHDSRHRRADAATGCSRPRSRSPSASRTETEIGANAVSVASAAVRCRAPCSRASRSRTVLLIGAGDTIELAARHLRAARPAPHAHRQPQHRRAHASSRPAATASRSGSTRLAAHLPEADIVISSTASPMPIVTRAMVAAALAARRHRPMLLLDLAVPRDIDADVAELDDVYLYTIDDLQNVRRGQPGGPPRGRARGRRADRRDEVARFEQDARTPRRGARRSASCATTAERARRQTLEQAQRMLAGGQSPQEVLEFLANTLTNRLLHAPSRRLREAR